MWTISWRGSGLRLPYVGKSGCRKIKYLPVPYRYRTYLLGRSFKIYEIGFCSSIITAGPRKGRYLINENFEFARIYAVKFKFEIYSTVSKARQGRKEEKSILLGVLSTRKTQLHSVKYTWKSVLSLVSWTLVGVSKAPGIILILFGLHFLTFIRHLMTFDEFLSEIL